MDPSHRMHEHNRLTFYFGRAFPDNLEHYLVCPHIIHVTTVALKKPLPLAVPSVLEPLSILPYSTSSVSLTFIMFTVYHVINGTYFKDLDASHQPGGHLFNAADAITQAMKLAKVAVDKLQSLRMPLEEAFQ